MRPGLDFGYPGFVHTVLVDMRARLARSARPDRIFEVTLVAVRQAGLVGRRRVLDSTPLYDAVAMMDTVTLVRSAVRGLLKAADGELAGALVAVLRRDDDYMAAGKPACDYGECAPAWTTSAASCSGCGGSPRPPRRGWAAAWWPPGSRRTARLGWPP